MPAVAAEFLLHKTEDQQYSITWELVEMQDLGPHPRWGFPLCFQKLCFHKISK